MSEMSSGQVDNSSAQDTSPAKPREVLLQELRTKAIQNEIGRINSVAKYFEVSEEQLKSAKDRATQAVGSEFDNLHNPESRQALVSQIDKYLEELPQKPFYMTKGSTTSVERTDPVDMADPKGLALVLASIEEIKKSTYVPEGKEGVMTPFSSSVDQQRQLVLNAWYNKNRDNIEMTYEAGNLAGEYNFDKDAIDIRIDNLSTDATYSVSHHKSVQGELKNARNCDTQLILYAMRDALNNPMPPKDLPVEEQHKFRKAGSLSLPQNGEGMSQVSLFNNLLPEAVLFH